MDRTWCPCNVFWLLVKFGCERLNKITVAEEYVTACSKVFNFTVCSQTQSCASDRPHPKSLTLVVDGKVYKQDVHANMIPGSS